MAVSRRGLGPLAPTLSRAEKTRGRGKHIRVDNWAAGGIGAEQHSLRIASHSEDETRTLGIRLARCLRGGELIGLVGELGAGKTCFVRGLAEGLGIAPQKVRSPTFTLVNEYSGGRLPLYHVDLYRLSPSPVDRMALRDYLYGDGVCVVEWFERLGEASPHLRIQFTFVGADERALVAQGRGARYDALVDRLREG
jgi:tRNA threonylcarbamoyladenosine biosynthesis protein TsaE